MYCHLSMVHCSVVPRFTESNSSSSNEGANSVIEQYRTAKKKVQFCPSVQTLLLGSTRLSTSNILARLDNGASILGKRAAVCGRPTSLTFRRLCHVGRTIKDARMSRLMTMLTRRGDQPYRLPLNDVITDRQAQLLQPAGARRGKVNANDRENRLVNVSKRTAVTYKRAETIGAYIDAEVWHSFSCCRSCFYHPRMRRGTYYYYYYY